MRNQIHRKDKKPEERKGTKERKNKKRNKKLLHIPLFPVMHCIINYM
jgi:hypothetical protein